MEEIKQISIDEFERLIYNALGLTTGNDKEEKRYFTLMKKVEDPDDMRGMTVEINYKGGDPAKAIRVSIDENYNLEFENIDSEIKKAKNWLNIYEQEWKIKKNKIHILINKYQENGIADNIVKNIFSGYTIIGKIKLNKKYNLLINTNYQKKYFDEEIKQEYEKISKKIIQLKNNSLKNRIRNFIETKTRVNR